jgi:VWFA-related protein
MPGQPEEPSIRVSVTLVQMDAVVTGRDGKQVSNLTKDDFEVLEDGKPRVLRDVSYIRSGASANPQANSPAASRPVNAAKLYRSEVSRSIALLVDDLRMSFEGVHHARLALSHFVDHQMQPGDLVAVISTSGGLGGVQPFTTDRKQLHAAIDRLRFLLWAGGSAGDLRAIGGPGEEDAGLDAIRRRRFNVGMMGTIRYVARGMRDLPGRKSMVLFADGLPVKRDADDHSGITTGEIYRVTDEAHRSAVVVYGMDVRGLVYPGLQAMDDVGSLETVEVHQALDDRQSKFRNSQQGLAFLARETGGNAFLNDNDISAGLARVLEDQSGYYLLAYRRPEEDAAKRNRLVVKLKRPGLQLRYRHGALGPEESGKAKPTTPRERLFSALASPFAADGFSFRFSPSFSLGENKKLELTSQVYFDGAQLSFAAPDASGMKAAKIQILALAEGETGMVGSPTLQTYTVRMKDGQGGGFVYTVGHEVKKPGAYQLRVAVLDETSGRVGSATRLVEIPDVSKGAVAVSGINMLPGDWRARIQEASGVDTGDVSGAARVFERGKPFSYGLVVYNPRPGTAIEPRLVRGAQVLWEGKRIAVADAMRAPAGGVLTLGAGTTPGEYELEVRLVNRDGKSLGPAQSVDFELR